MRTPAQILEEYLVAAARTGDRAAFARLVEVRGPRLLTHATRLLGEAEAARDVVQDAWVDILRGLGGLRDDRAFAAWAYRIVTRRCARLIRRRQHGRKLTEAYAAEAHTTAPDGGQTATDSAAVRAAIASLPPEQSATIALFYLEDMTVAEVATALDIPAGTVKTRLMHARAKLRNLLEDDRHDQTG